MHLRYYLSNKHRSFGLGTFLAPCFEKTTILMVCGQLVVGEIVSVLVKHSHSHSFGCGQALKISFPLQEVHFGALHRLCACGCLLAPLYWLVTKIRTSHIVQLCFALLCGLLCS